MSPSGTTPEITNLTGIVPPSHGALTGPGYSISFAVANNEGVVQGMTPGAHAVPVAGVNGASPEYLTGGFGSALTSNIADSGNYFSTGFGTITITFDTPQTSFALLWGSIDTGNSLTFNDAANFVVTGTQVQAAAAGFVSNGFQGPGGSAYVVVNTLTPFTTVTARSSTISFEFGGVAASMEPFVFDTPEPATLLLVGLGIAALVLPRKLLTQRM
jgi:hypothetical protein